MKKTSPLLLLIIVALLNLASPVRADLLSQSNWYDSSSAISSSPGHLLILLTNAPQYVTAYFAPSNSPITLSQPGNQIRLTWTFTPTNMFTFSTSAPVAISLAYTPDANRLMANGVPMDAPYGGYCTFWGAYAGNLFWYYLVGGRDDATTASPLFQGGFPSWQGWDMQTTAYSAGGPNGQVYTMTITITRNASGGVDVASLVMNGSTIVNQGFYTDPAPNTFSFNTVALFCDGGLGGSMDTTQMQVDYFETSPPVIYSQPMPATCYPGQPVTFTTEAAGMSPLSYQWKLNSQPIVGETNTTLTLTNVQTAQAGTYNVVVTNPDGSTNSADAILTVNPPLPAVPPPAGLVSWWPADGNANDIIGGNNGALENGVTYENGQASGQCFLFYQNNAAVQAGVATNLQLQDFTIECRVQFSAAGLSSPNGGPGFLFSYGPGGYGFGINDDGTLLLEQAGADSVTSVGSVNDTNWHHVAVTKSGTNVVFYVDGIADAAQGLTNIFEFSTQANIGAQGDASNFPLNTFYGAIDEMSIYNRALPAGSVSAIANAGAGGKCQTLPQLSVEFSGGMTTVQWPVWASGFSLQSREGDLSSAGAWSNAVANIETNGFNLNTIVPASKGRQFFRLSYPQL